MAFTNSLIYKKISEYKRIKSIIFGFKRFHPIFFRLYPKDRDNFNQLIFHTNIFKN